MSVNDLDHITLQLNTDETLHVVFNQHDTGAVSLLSDEKANWYEYSSQRKLNAMPVTKLKVTLGKEVRNLAVIAKRTH
ncbi:hypothetical protein N9R79_05840 [Vibrio sp.]|nr:hypothetical protein [Vibrio sp.]